MVLSESLYHGSRIVCAKLCGLKLNPLYIVKKLLAAVGQVLQRDYFTEDTLRFRPFLEIREVPSRGED
jgi:hypothetical protein